MNKKRVTTFIILLSILLLSLLLTGCKTYICYDGTAREDAKDCPTVPNPKIEERDAEKAVEKFGQAYARAKLDSFTLVTLYRKEAHWNADVLFTDVKTQTVNAATLKVDGKSASITCLDGCEYLGIETINETAT